MNERKRLETLVKLAKEAMEYPANSVDTTKVRESPELEKVLKQQEARKVAAEQHNMNKLYGIKE